MIEDGPYQPPPDQGGQQFEKRPDYPAVPPTMHVHRMPTVQQRLHRRVVANVRQERTQAPVNQSQET